MKKLIIKTILTMLTALVVMSCSNKKKDTIFKNVNVIPMTEKIALENMSVYIAEGKIKQIGSYDQLEFSKDVEIIDGEGKYLIPGLTDMYVKDLTEADLILLLKSGVTTVRNIVGNNDILLYRSLIEDGKMPGPEIFTTGPVLDNNLFMKMDPTGKEYMNNIKYIVKQIKDNGYDYVYIHPGMKGEIKSEVINSADKYAISVLDHYDISNNSLVSGTLSALSYKDTNNRIQNEFVVLNRKGLTPYEILLTATVKSTKSLGISDSKGTVEVGKDADLVLLEENPLEDIDNTRKISGVMTKGIWYTQDQLTEELNTLVDWYRE